MSWAIIEVHDAYGDPTIPYTIDVRERAATPDAHEWPAAYRAMLCFAPDDRQRLMGFGDTPDDASVMLRRAVTQMVHTLADVLEDL